MTWKIRGATWGAEDAGRGEPAAAAAAALSRLTALVFIDETGEAGDPDVGLVGRVGDEVHRLELLRVDDGEGALLRVVLADVLTAQHVSVLAHANLLNLGQRDCNDKIPRPVKCGH